MHRRSRSRSRSRAPEDHSLIEAFEPAPPMHSRQSLQQTRQRLLATRFNPPVNQQNTPMQRDNAPASVMRNSLGQSAPAHRSVQRPTDPRTQAWAPRPNLPVNRASDQAMANQRRSDDPVNARTPQIQANRPIIPTNRSNSSLNQPNVTPMQRQNGPSNVAQMLADRRAGAVTPNQRLATNSTSIIGGQSSHLGPVQQMKMRVNWSTQRPSGLATPVQPRPIGQASNNNSSTSLMRQFPIRGGRGQQPQQQQMRRAAPPGNCDVPSPPQMPLADEEDNVLPHSLLPDYEYSNEDNNPENNNNNSGGGGGATTTPNAPQRRHAIHSDDSDDDEDDEDEADDYRGGNSGTHAQPTAKRGRIETTYHFNTTTIVNNSNNDNMNLFDGPSTSAAAAAAADNEQQQQLLAMVSSSSSNWVDTQNALANEIATNFDDEIKRKDELCNKFMSNFSLVINAIEQTLHQKKSK
ncbi:hypothetical protein niasHT_002109 [Heterodera trifolii]|uniref:Uncharacterized protein n=1 Tax=Heterodera trifolii TaxID=157864 RepID=A0ABD2MD29_9BILA